MPLDGLPDPTTLVCQVCRAEFPLNEARVIRALARIVNSRGVAEFNETARLCWVCAHLKYGAIKEGQEAKELMG